MPDPLISSAFVRIKPEPKSVSAFSKEVRASIEKSLVARPIKVPVIARLTPFRKAIQTELTAKPFTIPVVPVLAPGFKSTISRLTKEAAVGVTVPVVPVGKAGAAGGAAKPPAAATVTRAPVSTAASREATFQKKLNDLALARTASVRALAKVEQAEGTVKQKLAVATSAVSKAEGILEKHLAAQAALEGTLTKKQELRLATSIKRAREDVLAATAAKGLIEATILQSETDLKAEASAKARSDLNLRLVATEEQLIAAQVADSTITGNVAQKKAILTATTQAATAATALNADAQALATETLAAEDAALAVVTAGLAAKAGADKIAARSAVETAIADNDAAAAALKRAAAQKSLEKGLLATALAAAGARGATLAASFEFLAGAAIATGLFKSIQLAERLQTELNVFRVTAAATAVEMDKVAAAAKRLGADITLPSVSANDAANAMTELAKAGLSVTDSIDAARGTLQLATAAQLDNATAVNITASALNAFGLAGNEAVHVADLLAGSANAAQGGIGDMGQSLSSVASVARQAGVSIEDTVALITLLAKNGIQGAEGGTALRVAIIRLIAPTKDAREELQKLNIAVLDSAGNLRPTVFADIADATNKLGASQRNAALQTIFGTRAIRAQAVIGREGVEGLNAMRDATNQQGAAAKLAAARTAGFAGDIEGLKNASATLGLALGESLIPTLSVVVKNLSEVASGAIDATDALKKFNDAIPGAGGGILPDFSPGFDPGLFDPGLKGIAARIKEIRASADLLKQGNFTKSLGNFELPSADVAKFSHEAELATISADDLAESLKNLVPKKGEGDVAAQIAFLENLRKQITGTGDDADAARSRLDALIRLTIALGRSPTALEIKVLFEKGSVDKTLIDAQRRINQARLNIQLGVDQKSVVFLGNSAKDAAAVAAQDAEKQFSSIFGDQMAASPLGQAQWDPFFLNAKPAAEKAANDAAAAFSSTFDTQVAVLEATGGSDSAILSVLRAQLARRRRLLARAQAKFKAAPTQPNDDFVQRAAGLVSETEGKIKDITDQQLSDAKSAADKIKSARDKADQAFLDALGLKRGRIENAILRAEGTASLADDIKTHTQLRDLIKKKLQEAAKTIKDAQLRAETVQSLTADLISENQKLRELNTQLISSISERFQARIDIAQIIGTVGSIRKIYAAWIDALQKALGEATKGSKIAKELKLAILQTQKSAFDAINEGFDLDVQIAQAQDRPVAEIRARERFIAQLRKEQAQFKRGTLEWKRLQLEIVQQQKAIDDAKKANDDLNKSFSELAFSFLTTQQGFAANLLGNLLPSGAIGNTVAGKLAGSTPSSGAGTRSPGGGGPSGSAGGGSIGSFDFSHLPQEDRAGLTAAGLAPKAGGGPGAFVSEASRQGAADRVGGFTAAQAATLVALMRQVVHLLAALDAKGKHPENKHQHRQTNAALDTRK